MSHGLFGNVSAYDVMSLVGCVRCTVQSETVSMCTMHCVE